MKRLSLLLLCAQLGMAHAADPACTPAPFGTTTLFMRGTMNQWGTDEAFELQYRCDAYYLNLKLQGEHQFKIADASWSDATIYANAPGASQPGLPGKLATGPATAALVQRFAGEPQMLRLAFTPEGPQARFLPGQFVDPRLQPLTDPVALSLRHDSRDGADKQPFGAVPAGTRLQWSFTALPGVQQATLVIERRRFEGDQKVIEYSPLARLPMQRSADGATGRERFTAQWLSDQVGVVGYWFDVVIAGQTYALQNNSETIHWTREKGSNGLAQVGLLPGNLARLRRLRVSVYQPGFKTPDWAADAVYYSIFPERFRNGDKTNDPQPGQRRYQNHDIERHTRWIDPPYKPGSGDGSDAVHNNDFFGGDLAGIIEKLDYIRDLGANTIYMTPVFRAASNHKYDTADFKNIDPGFGSNADFTRLTQEAARRGIRVIPDTSLNHSGSDSIYFDRFGNHSANGNVGAFANAKIHPESPWASWYRFKPEATEPDKQYQGWVGVADLPELDKTAPAWRNYAYRDNDSVTRLWLQRGASGWRMDVAPWVPDDFWREWRSVVKQTNPQAITIAETWFDASKHLLGDMFDSTMNYIFRNALLDYAAGGPAPHAVRNLEFMREAYPPTAHFALMNLLSTHDQARALHRFGDTRIGGAPVGDDVVALAKQRLLLAVLFQMSYPGSPAVYYGDEVGLTGGDDPYNRAPYPWADEGGSPDNTLLARFKQLIAMRQKHAVLRRGELLAPLWVDEHVIVLGRRLQQGLHISCAITATNNSTQARSLQVALPAGCQPEVFIDALDRQMVRPHQGLVSLTLPPLFGQVLVQLP
jgi:glycosidase